MPTRPDSEHESAADKLESICLACVICTYAMTAVSHLISLALGRKDGDRFLVLDIIVFAVCLGLTIFPLVAAKKLAKVEQEDSEGTEMGEGDEL